MPKRSFNGKGLQCPHCQSIRLSVVETRPHSGTITRRRKCKACGKTFITAEVITTRQLRGMTLPWRDHPTCSICNRDTSAMSPGDCLRTDCMKGMGEER